jgi:cell division topological specificity factor
MASFWERLMGRREPSSAEMARERLKLVLVTDRSDLSPDKLEQMQGEIIEVIKRYLKIDERLVHIKLEQRDRVNYLVADIPLARDHTAYGPAEMPPADEPEPSGTEADEPGPAASEADDTQPKRPAGLTDNAQ